MTDEFAESAKRHWIMLVGMALATADVDRLAKGFATNGYSSYQTARNKIVAIRYLAQIGESRESIEALGQTAVLSRYAKAKKKARGPERVLSHRMSASLADAIECESPSPDAEEPLFTRLCRVLQIRTIEDIFEYLLAHFSGMSDLEILHDGGEWYEKREAGKKRAQIPPRQVVD
jgi:hypothetical protein